MDRKTKDVELFGEKLILAGRSVRDRLVLDKAFEGIELNTFENISNYTAQLLVSGLKHNIKKYKSVVHFVYNYKTWRWNRKVKKLISLKNIITLPYETIEELSWIILAWEGIEKPKEGVQPKVEKKKVLAPQLSKG